MLKIHLYLLENRNEFFKNCLCHPYSRIEAEMAVLGCHIFKQISFNYINIQLNIQLRKSKQYSTSSSRASLLPREICLLAGNWNLADPLNGIL